MNFRKYNFTLISTILVVSCLTVVVEFLVRKIPNVYGYKFEEITKNDKHYKTLILGSSHSFFGINPDYLSDPSFNAANVSQDFKYDSYVLEKSLDAHERDGGRNSAGFGIFTLPRYG